tara:strand:+ start:39670 stop:41016 length:1347 start_codon:yes stop_codon:yes gene_type:complete
MKNICFIANYYKTDVFVKLAQSLKKYDITTYWIIPNRTQYLELSSQFPKNQLLYIGKREVLSESPKKHDFDLKINELVYGDRVLKKESNTWTSDYLLKLQSLYYNFIKKNSISYIFGEVTWAHELLAHRLILQEKKLNCEFLNPHTIRIPNGRFAFFTDESQSNIKEISKTSIPNTDSIKIEKPSYLEINNKLIAQKGTLKHNLILIKNFLLRTNQDANDPTLFRNPFTQLQTRSAEVCNRFLFNKCVKETSVNSLPTKKKKILFTLHKQPEASIDVIGRYYENQLELITNIWRILPEDHILLVKEHSNAIGDRSLKFYNTIKKLRKTYLIDNKADSHKLLDDCDVFFTVSGTIAYEAALKGKYSFTFAPTFFNKMSTCTEVSWKDFNNYNLEDLTNHNPKGLTVNQFSNWLMENSFEGIMSDAFGDPRSIEKENIDSLTNAFKTVIK